MSDGAYARAYARSLEDPQGFWSDAANDIDWITPPGRVLDASRPPFYRWFPGATLNTCFNAVDRHVEAGRGEQVAVHYDSPVTGSKRSITYARVARRRAPARRCPRRRRGREGRPGRSLHADGPRGGRRDAGLRADRGGALGGLRRVRAGRTRHADRRREAQGRAHGVLRHRAQPGRRVQADDQRGGRPDVAPARRVRGAPA